MPAIPASHRDLLDGQFATLATVGPDGSPQLSEVWFLAEDDVIGLSLNTTRQKTKNLLANPAANLFLLDLAVPYRYLEVRGDAEISADDDPRRYSRLLSQVARNEWYLNRQLRAVEVAQRAEAAGAAATARRHRGERGDRRHPAPDPPGRHVCDCTREVAACRGTG